MMYPSRRRLGWSASGMLVLAACTAAEGVPRTGVINTGPAPSLTQVILTPPSVSLTGGATQQFAATGVLSSGNASAPAVTYAATGGTITAAGLYTAGGAAGDYRVIATQKGGALADTSLVTITPPPGALTTLVSEGFEDTNVASRGWFDATNIAIASDARPDSPGTHALEWHWSAGDVAPQGIGTTRFDFAPTNSVYLSYWVKTSANWFEPGHQFYFLTTADDHYIGPSVSHLTTYDQYSHVGSNTFANVEIADVLMIDANKLNVDLFGVTEQRSIAGPNGRHEFDDATSTVGWDMYLNGSQWMAAKFFQPTTPIFTDATKTAWHHIESYQQLNSIAGGIAQQDGVYQYWVDGELIMDRHDVYFRTGANPTMQFRTFLMGPWIGAGATADQYVWIDDLLIATTRP